MSAASAAYWSADEAATRGEISRKPQRISPTGHTKLSASHMPTRRGASAGGRPSRLLSHRSRASGKMTRAIN